MKKYKYKNKKKNNKKKSTKRFRWNVWLTIISVFLGVATIGGAVVLGVFLTGGFEEKIVEPKSITFNFDEDKYLEVEDDFTLTLTTDTKDVTANKVTLSFDKGVAVVRRKENDEYIISNKIIEVPEIVTIGEPFNVHLLKERLTDENGVEILDKGNPIDWIVGGLSTLYATSEAPSTINTKINIAVDVPVYTVETVFVNSNGVETNQIVINESFTVKTKFIPAKSEYMYSDNLRDDIAPENKRVKRAYYQAVNTDKVTAVYDNNKSMHFVAGDTIVNENDSVRIDSYTFINASSQIEQENQFIEITDAPSYHQRMLEAMYSSPLTKSASGFITIGEASIGNFIVAKNKVTMNAEQPLRLYLNEYLYQSASDFLGVNIYSTSGQILDNILSSVAINFQLNGKDAAFGDNKVLTVIGGDQEGRFIDINGQRYYKPNAEGANKRYSYWDLTAYKANEITMNIVLLVENETTIFKLDGQELVYKATLSILKHEEQALAWTDQSDIDVMLGYDNNGNINPHTLNLNSLVSIPKGNIYQDYVFFANFGGGVIDDYIEQANKIFGTDGYNLERSKTYSTNSGNLALFAIDRTQINLYDSGSFSLYYATIKTENGQPLYDSDGRFEIAVMCAGYVRVTCEKELNSSSVASGRVNTQNFPANQTTGEVSIPQGTDLNFAVTYTVSKESISVFRDELQQGYLTPILKDNDGNDLSSYFIVDDGTFTIDGETGNGVLTYNFIVRTSVEIENEDGIYFRYVALNYNDGEDKNITWEFPIITTGENAQVICIYKPIAKHMLLLNGDWAKSPIKVNQTLTEEGDFETTIIINEATENEKVYTDISSFLNEVFTFEGQNALVILDQKNSGSTLNGQWKFEITEGNNEVISLTENGQSFTFKDTNGQDTEVKLIIESIDGNSTLNHNLEGTEQVQFHFVINSTGISQIAYDTNKYTYSNTHSNLTTEISSAVVNKYGASHGSDTTLNVDQQYIVLKNLVKFYIGEDNKLYDKVLFKLNPQYILEGALSNEHLLDLYGENGMLTLYESDSQEIDFGESLTAETIRSVLLTKNIYKIKINKNFAIEQPINIIAYDNIGAVNTSITLNILANVVVSSVTYPSEGDTIYAGRFDSFELQNLVTNKNRNTTEEKFTTLYGSGKYHIVYQDNKYQLIPAQENPTYKVYGYFDGASGKIEFEDFWEEESRNYIVFFQPEGDNTFAVNHVINFEVHRDLVITDGTEKTFYILDSASRGIQEFVKVRRITNSDEIPDVELSYLFDSYLTYNEEDKLVVKDGISDYFFDYNKQIIQSKLFVTLKGQQTENALKTIDVDIRLYDGSGDVYNDIARILTSNVSEAYPTSNTAKVQTVGSVEYLMLDLTQVSWKFGSLGEESEYKILPVTRDYNKVDLTGIYNVYGSTEYMVDFKSAKNILTGLNDNTKYIAIKFFYKSLSDTSSPLAVMHLPIILSNVGYNPVVYDKNVEAGHELETALTSPEILLERLNNKTNTDDIYNEIEAGKVTQILSELAYDQIPAKGGLYTPSGTIQTLNVYTIQKYGTEVIKSTLITKEGSKSKGFVSLNHLAEGNEVFIAFEYILTISGNSQTFYYLLKVVPDVKVENEIYKYNGDKEYIENSPIDLEEIFDETTLHENYKRFYISKNITLATSINNLVVNVESENALLKLTYNDVSNVITLTKGENIINLSDYYTDLSTQYKLNVLVINGNVEIIYNNEKVFENVEIKHEIVSVKEGEDDPITDPSKWENIIDISFNSNYSIMSYNLISKQKVTVVLKRIYPGSENSLAVIGGEQYYTFIFNQSTEDYTVSFEKVVDDGKSEFIKETHESDKELEYQIKNSEGSKDHEFKIYLIKNGMAGGSPDKTKVYDKLDVSLKYTEQRENLFEDTYVLPEGEEENIKEKSLCENGFYYDKSTGNFTLRTLDYIDSDKQVVFTVYIEEGYLATLTFNLKANATASAVKTELNGGSNYSFADLINLYIGDATEENKQIIGTDFNISNLEGQKVVVSGDSNLVKWDVATNSIIVADLIKDKKVTFTFTIIFTADAGEGLEAKTYVFTQEFTLKANVKPKTTYVYEDQEVVAGSKHIIDPTDLYTFIDENQTELGNTTIRLSASSTSTAYKGIEGYEVEVGYVSERVTVELSLDVVLIFDTVEQKFTLTYSFTVIPSVLITNSYPSPNNEDVMDFEYLENNQTYNNIIEFFNSNPIFAESKRIIIKDNDNLPISIDELTGEQLKDLSIIITDESNAKLTVGGFEIKENEKITNFDSQIVFSKTSENSDSIINFRFTYQEVSQTYVVKIINNSLTMVLNPVNNNLFVDEISETIVDENGEESTVNTTVSYEKIYVDKTSTSNLFAQHRMIQVEMNSSMSTYANEYYLIFKDAEGLLYSSRSIYFGANDQGKSLIFDLGTSMANKDFVGAYLASTIEEQKWLLNIGGSIKDGEEDVKSLVNIANFAERLFVTDIVEQTIISRVKLANRVQMIYGQLNGEDILVDYKYYQDLIIKDETEFNFTDKTDEIEVCDNLIVKDFNRNDGSINKDQSFTLTYYYMATLDIDVKQAATISNNHVQVIANQEYLSIIDLFGIIHPSTNKKVLATDFVEGDGITFSIVASVDADDAINKNIIEDYEISSFKINTEDLQYIYERALINSSNSVYNYSIIPFGARNTGDYVLGRLQYTANGFNKVFYIVIKIKPDYVVTFGGSQDNSGKEEEGTIVSNLDYVYTVAEVSGDYYKDFTLVGEGGHLSIKHAGEENELSTSKFDITITENVVIDSQKYNDTTNLTQKIFYPSSQNLTDWEKTDGKYSYKDTSALTLTQVNKVFFGNQYFMIEGQDDYEYKFRLYFMLQTTSKTPKVQSSVTIAENGYFDFGVEYELLSIVSEESADDNTTYHINSNFISPTSKDKENVPLIVLEEIETWLFNAEYDKLPLSETNSMTYLNALEGGGYASNIPLSKDDQKYLSLPNINNVSIVGDINFYAEGSSQPVLTATATKYDNLDNWQRFATSSQGYFNGEVKYLRDPYTKNTITSIEGEETTTITEGLWKVGRLKETDLFGNANTAQLKMLVPLKYVSTDGHSVEYYDCPVTVTLKQEIDIVQKNKLEEGETSEYSIKVQRDGQPFSVEEQFDVTAGNSITTNITYLNDTLEVLVPKNLTSMTFELSLQRDGKTISASVPVSNSGTSFASTKYISISQYLGVNVKSDEVITISKWSNEEAKFYYNNQEITKSEITMDGVMGTVVKTFRTFTIAQVSDGTIDGNDVIYVEDALLLGNTGYYDVEKYYILQTEFDGDSNIYHYRASAKYYVTGMAYKLTKTFDDSIGFVLNVGDNNLETWSEKAFILYQGDASNGTIKVGNAVKADSIVEYLNFTIKDDESTAPGDLSEITSYGCIKISNEFTVDYYVKVVIRMGVSGQDRDINNSTDVTYLEIGELNLSIEKTLP